MYTNREVKNISELFMVYLCTKSWDTNLQFLQKHENGKGVKGFKKVPISEREIVTPGRIWIFNNFLQEINYDVVNQTI